MNIFTVKKVNSLLGGLLVTLMAIGLSAPAFAGVKGHTINHRQHKQMHRIHQGMRSGQLTPAERFRLAQAQRRVAFAEHRARHDGHISAKEAYKLDRLQDRQNRMINKQKHDHQNR